MFYNLLNRMASDTGLDVAQQRPTLSRLINASTKEMHQRLECNKIYREITLVVPPNEVISLPSYIGELRGVRQHRSMLKTDYRLMSVPRFTKSTVEFMCNGWTDMGDSALCNNLTAIGPLTFQSNVVENAVITINGQTDNANVIQEQVTLNAATCLSVNLFGPRIDAIASFSTRTGDIAILDDNGVMVAVLGTNQQKTRYKLIDVSKFGFFNNDDNLGDTLMDVLYKVPYSYLVNDSDSFAGSDDYDDAIYYYAMYLFYLPQNGKEQDAASCKMQAFQSLFAVKTGEEDGIPKKLNFGKNKFYNLAMKFSRYQGQHPTVGNTWTTNYTY